MVGGGFDVAGSGTQLAALSESSDPEWIQSQGPEVASQLGLDITNGKGNRAPAAHAHVQTAEQPGMEESGRRHATDTTLEKAQRRRFPSLTYLVVTTLMLV
jgi:hypothetical protein